MNWIVHNFLIYKYVCVAEIGRTEEQTGRQIGQLLLKCQPQEEQEPIGEATMSWNESRCNLIKLWTR